MREKTKKTMLERSRKQRAIVIFGMVAMCFMSSYAMTFAAGFLDEAGAKLNELTTALALVALPAGGAAWTIAKLWQMVVPEKQGRMEPKEWGRSVIVTLVSIAVGGKFLTWVFNFFQG